MTSLEFIMDMDVDKEEPQTLNKKDGPSSSTPGTRLDRDHLASDHQHPRDRLATSSTDIHIHGATGRHNRSPSSSSNIIAAESSTSALASPLGPTTRPAPARGNSSNYPPEDMYRHASSSGAGGEQPSRPMGSPGEVQVKLTPITGRVSRAKKGVPVHTCEICRPPKVSPFNFHYNHSPCQLTFSQTFTRAEHLR